jgi:hypothetical protein
MAMKANRQVVNEAVANARRHFPELLNLYRASHTNNNSTIFLRSKISMDVISVLADVMHILDTLVSAATATSMNPAAVELERFAGPCRVAVGCALKLLIYAQVQSARLYEADKHDSAASDIALIPSAIDHGLRKAEDLFQKLPAQDIKTVMSRMKNVIKVTVDYKFQDAIRDLVIAMRIVELMLDQCSSETEKKTSLLDNFSIEE